MPFVPPLACHPVLHLNDATFLRASPCLWRPVLQAADQVPRKWMTSNRFGAAAAAAVVVLLLAAAFTTPVAGAVAPEQQHALLAHSAATMPDDSMFVAAQGTAHSPQQLPPAPTPVWQHSRVRIRPATAAGQPPLPELLNYDFNTSRDTFELCREMSGLGGRELSLEELLPALSLPADLTRRGRLDLASFVELLRLVQPDFRVIYKPMLAGEPELGGLLTTPGGLPRLVHFTVKDKDSLAPHQVCVCAVQAHLWGTTAQCCATHSHTCMHTHTIPCNTKSPPPPSRPAPSPDMPLDLPPRSLLVTPGGLNGQLGISQSWSQPDVV